MAEVLVYDYIDSYSATDFVKQLNAVPTPGEDVTIRICTGGGEVSYAFAMISKLKEIKNPKKAIVDGKAYSGGCFMLAYMDDVECVDTAEGLIHRAAYADWFEKSEYFDDATKGNLERMNKSLRAALEAKIDVPAFEAIAKCTMDDVFSMDDRKDVFLTAAQMKKIGLVNRIVKITPQRKALVESKIVAIASTRAGYKMAAVHESSNKNSMDITTLEELKAHYPAVYALAIQKGRDEEYDRVMAFMKFRKVDAKAVAKAIKKRKEMSQSFMAEMNAKANSPEALKRLEQESAKPVNTEEPVANEVEKKKEAEVQKFLDEARAIRKHRSGQA
jgi:ATP-dependent protease ClpP protease subunit